MRNDEWDKLKRNLPPSGITHCPICQKAIDEHARAEDITYAKTRAGSHLFIHEKCLTPKEAQDGRH